MTKINHLEDHFITIVVIAGILLHTIGYLTAYLINPNTQIPLVHFDYLLVGLGIALIAFITIVVISSFTISGVKLYRYFKPIENKDTC